MTRTITRAIQYSTALAIGLLAAGCVFDRSGNEAANQPGPNVAGSWKVKLQSACPRYIEEYCVGQYGFTVSADRRFEAGPGPKGQVQSGFLSEEEHAKVENLVRFAAQAPRVAGAEPQCEDHDFGAEESEDKITLTLNGNDHALFASSLEENGRYCFQTATAEPATQLRDAVVELARKYYSVPFPDHCAEAVASVSALFAPLQTCSADADCVYVSSELTAIPPTSNQLVITDNCTLVRPIVVANPAALVTQRDKVIDALVQAQNSCADRIFRESCEGIKGFDGSKGAPVCQQGYCRVNPDLVH